MEGAGVTFNPNTYIVLAQGKGERLKEILGNKPKQGIKITAAHTILERTLWQIQRRYAAEQRKPAVVIAPVALDPQIQTMGRGYRHELHDPGLCVLDGLAQTRGYWSMSGSTVLLLGDVIWASEDLERARAGYGPVCFSHTADLSPSLGEIFAVTWRHDVNALIWRCLDEVPCRHGRHGQDYDGVPQPGHLRNLKWMLDRYLGKFCGSTIATGFTKDIDTPQDYRNLPELGQLAHDDDERYRADSYERDQENP
jgi:hypothetical protein